MSEAKDRDPSRSAWSLDSDRLREVLEAAYLELEQGRNPDFDELAEGDKALANCASQLFGKSEATTAKFGTQFLSPASRRDHQDQRIGEFTIQRLLGSGGMSQVFIAKQESLGRLVALKVLDPRLAEDSTRRTRFKREAEIAASIVHPSVVPIYGVGEAEGQPFIAMKLLKGPTLLALEKPRSAQEVAQLGSQLARALHSAHICGIVHRDVKPSNIILEGSCPVLLDFGLAWAFGNPDLTAPDSAPGTLLYMSPEQLEGSRGLDPRTDIYSLGTTLFELVHGEPIFGASSPATVIQRIKNDAPPRLELSRRDRDLETILLKAVAKDRRDRFQSAEELADDLDRYLNHDSIQARRSSLAKRLQLSARKYPRLASVLATLAVVIISLIVVFLIRHAQDENQVFRLRQRTERELKNNNLEVASALLDRLGRKDHPDLSRRIEQRLDDEYLMDVVLDFGNFHDHQRLREILQRTPVNPGRGAESFTAIPLVCAAYLVNGPAESLRILEAAEDPLEGSRAMQAWRALLEQGVPPEHWVDTSSLSRTERAADHLLTALALCFMNAPLKSRQAELDAVFRIDPGNFGARHLAGRLAFQAGNYEESLAFYRGCQRRGTMPEFALRSVARCLIALGRVDEAILTLEEIKSTTSEPNLLRLRMEIAAQQGDGRTFDLLYGQAQTLWPEEGELSLLAATRFFNLGKLKEAHATAEEALTKNLTPARRAMARLLLASVDLQDQGFRVATDNVARGTESESLLRKSLNDMEAAVSVVPEGERLSSDFELLSIRLLLHLGETKTALARLLALSETEPRDLAVQVLTASLIDAAQGPGKNRDAGLEPSLLPGLEVTAQRLKMALAQNPEGRSITWQSAAFFHLRLCYWAEDWAAFDEALDFFGKNCGDLDTAQNRQGIMVMKARADLYR